MRGLKKLLMLVLLGASLGTAATGCAPTSDRRGTGEYFDDKVITSKVKTALIDSKEVDARDINVDTFRGVVQLSGFVPTRQMAERAAAIARSIQGVKEVKDDMRLRPQR